jgi:Sugar (and other) transporter
MEEDVMLVRYTNQSVRQMWTAFGIMLGNIMGVAFGGLAPDLGWRLILGSTVVLPLFVCVEVYYCPESPRWLIQKGRVSKAYESFRVLRPSDLQAARDTYYVYVGVELERKVNTGKNFFTMFRDLFTVARNRPATLASWIVMFMQQFCGVNVIAYYSTTIFIDSGYGTNAALLASMGTGIVNWVFALPAFFTIDTWGRRNLLLFTFPFLAIFLFWTGFSFWFENEHTRTAMVATGMYLFEVFYSPGEGPVPFTYSAECFPLHVRDVGMSWATATTWTFNFVLGFSCEWFFDLPGSNALILYRASSRPGIQATGRFWMVCWMVHVRMVPGALIRARDQGTDAGRA